MKDYESLELIMVRSANGSYLELSDGRKIIDAISSWWCKSLGHGHPKLKEAMIEQLDKLEHVIGAGVVNETITLLSEKLASLTPNLNKVFYGCSGSDSVEIALKMALHANQNLGNYQKTKFVALSNGYHGESSGALSVSDLGRFKAPYEKMLFDVNFIPSIPYVNSVNDPLWETCESHWKHAEIFLDQQKDELAAIILEPIVQGAGSMKIYSKDFLVRLSNWSKKNKVFIIADEIMTGFGRTGKMLAIDHAGIEPDFICLSKALTAGFLPMSAVLTSTEIYNIFYDDSESRAFLHSNTFSGNALAASVAVASIKIYEEENICQKAEILGIHMKNKMQEIERNTGIITNVRTIGAIVAADIISSNPKIGSLFYKKAIELGAFIRPLGNTIYWLLPLNTDFSTLEELKYITERTLLSLLTTVLD